MVRGRFAGGWLVASTLATLGLVALNSALAQQASPKAAPPSEPPVQVEVKKHLVSPSDPIALVNGEAITRQQLADECVARKGEEVLEALIARKLIEQAVKAKGLQVTPAEVDAEIERVAQNVAGVSREQWLATLARERKISPSQYARDVIFPMLAMRRLAEPRVQVTEEDMRDGYAAQFGEQLRCRMIMLNDQRIAIEVWEQLKKNPEAFETIARERSIDQASRALGGLLEHPITRHAYPRQVSDAAFKDLVDGVQTKPGDDDAPAADPYKPKDGDISGVIQVNEATWVILKREGVIPARPYDANDAVLRENIRKALFEAKVQDEVGTIWDEVMRQAAIENRLTGHIKPSGAEMAQVPGAEAPEDGQVQPASTPAPSATGAANLPKMPTPAAVSAEDAAKAESLRKR